MKFAILIHSLIFSVHFSPQISSVSLSKVLSVRLKMIIVGSFILLVGCLQSLHAAPKLVDDGKLELLILHNNDMHARFEQTSINGNKCSLTDVTANQCYGGFARVAHEVREYRKQAENGGTSVLYLNAGDTYTGTPWFQLYKENITSTFLNALKPDAIVSERDKSVKFAIINFIL